VRIFSIISSLQAFFSSFYCCLHLCFASLFFIFITLFDIRDSNACHFLFAGDLVPASDFGKLIAVACSFFGILVISVPISVVTMNFHQVFERMRAIRSVNFTETNLLSAALKHSYHAMAQKEDEALAAAASAAAAAAMKGLHSNADGHASADDESTHSTRVHVGDSLEMTPTQPQTSPLSANAASPSPGNGSTDGADGTDGGSSGKSSATIVAPHELDAAGVQKLSVEDMRQHMFVDVEMQINLVLQRNQEWLMENINIMVARRRVIVRHQIEMILKQVPIFYRNVNRFHEPPTEANTGDGLNNGGMEQVDGHAVSDAGDDAFGRAVAEQNSTEDDSDGELGEPIEPSAGEFGSSETANPARPLCLEDDSALFPELASNPFFRASTISALSAAPPSLSSMPPPAPSTTKTVSAAAAVSQSSAPESTFASSAMSASSASASESRAPSLLPLLPPLPSLPTTLTSLPNPALSHSMVFASSSSSPPATIALGTSDSMPTTPAPFSFTLPPSSPLPLSSPLSSSLPSSSAASPSAASPSAASPSAATTAISPSTSATSPAATRARAKAEARVAAAAARGHGALLLRALSSPKR
jgi:hypothetical protein